MIKKILYIDDEPNSCLLVQTCLGKFGHWQVETCGSLSAREQARSCFWDAILLEVALVQINGFILLKQLQNDPKTLAIPVIFLTSRVMPEELLYYQQFNIAGIIAKPFDLWTLKQKIAEKLNWEIIERYSA